MKLYWRVKINGKWTWRPAKIATNIRVPETVVLPYDGEEE